MEPEAAIAADAGASTTKIATAYIIWIVRIALPIIFFWVWYRTQPEAPSWYSKPHEISRSRADLLKVRKSVGNSAAPQAVANLTTSHEAYEANAAPQRKPRGNAKARPEPRAEVRAEEPPAPVRVEAQDTAGPAPSEQGDRQAGAGEQKAKGAAALADKERRLLEKTLNYIAFSHKDRPQPFFLPVDGQQPPTPKKRPGAGEPVPAAVTQSESAGANADAQTVLDTAGKLDLKPSDISKALYSQLTESRMRVSEATLALMAESCANAGDLKGASDFLMKMEAAGHCPDSALLDKVMDLFSEGQDEKAAAAAAAAPVADYSPDAGEFAEAGALGSSGPAPVAHPWSVAKEAAEPHPHALNFGAYSDDEHE